MSQLKVGMTVYVHIDERVMTPNQALREVGNSISFGQPEVLLTSVVPVLPTEVTENVDAR